ncbi:unnamed protein product [Clavelina lepadiformis]|uniref:Telomere length and silencing protein 1 homolog n=1 Tax=Clavelina lepadiformis TaxID=159417 RepID=A0ABP0F1R3_CLALP
MPAGKSKQFRRRQKSESSEEANETDTSDVLEATRELQKIRKRQTGLSAAALATGMKLTKEDEVLMENDPFKLQTGGLITMSRVKDRNRDRTYEDTDRDVTNLGSTFSVETNRRDEDAELTAYIEGELKRIKGEVSTEIENSKLKSAEDALYQLPEHLQIKSNTRSEEMLSNQMLSGIPEVDLGIDVKIKNIERTEEAKQKLITELSQKKEKTTSFVPSNMAVNYVQHKRFMHNDNVKEKKKKEPAPEAPPLVVGDKSFCPPTEPQKRAHNSDKSTDNYHYDKFRKAARRY